MICFVQARVRYYNNGDRKNGIVMKQIVIAGEISPDCQIINSFSLQTDSDIITNKIQLQIVVFM